MAAKDICEEINVEDVLKQKRQRSTKRHFSYESHDEPFSDALRNLEVGFFNVVVDAAKSVFTERFSTFHEFRVLTNFPSLADEELAEQCNALGTTLHFEGHSDLDSRELVQEIKNFPWTALRIALTLPVTVAQAERSCSKVELIKSYLRSTMSQERLTGLAVISINHSIGEQISYDDIIDDFASSFSLCFLFLVQYSVIIIFSLVGFV